MQQEEYLKNNDIQRDSAYFPIVSTVAIQRDDGALCMHVVIVKSNSTDHNERSDKVRVMETGRVITCNARYIQKMPVMRVQYLRQQIVKGAGHLRDTFANTEQIRQDWIFNPFMTCPQMSTNRSNNQEDKMPDQQSMWISGNKM